MIRPLIPTALALLAVELSFVGCSSTPAAEQQSQSPDGSTPLDDASAEDAGASDARKDSKDVVDVEGRVLDSAGKPNAGKEFRVFDASGRAIDGLTDADGRFSAPGIVTPYDVRIGKVTKQGGALTTRATVYLGLSRPKPVLVADTDGSGVMIEQTIHVSGFSPPCDCDYITSFGPPSKSAILSSAFLGPLTREATRMVRQDRAMEPFWLHTLIKNKQTPAYWYAANKITPATSLNVTPQPSVVPTAAAISASATSSADWSTEVALELNLPDETTIKLESKPDVLNVVPPNLPGGRLVVTATFVPKIPTTTGLFFARSTSGIVSPTTTSIPPLSPTNLKILKPTDNEAIPRTTATIRWQTDEAALATIWLDPPSGENVDEMAAVTVWTDQSEVRLSRLADLGIKFDDANAIHGMLATSSPQTLDLVTTNDDTVRQRFLDLATPLKIAFGLFTLNFTP